MKEVTDNFIATLARLNECESKLRKVRTQSKERDVVLEQALQESTKQSKKCRDLVMQKRQQTELNFRMNLPKHSK